MEQKMGPAHSFHFVRFRTCFPLILLVWLLLSAARAAQTETEIETQTLLNFRNDTTYYLGAYAPLLWFTWNETDENPCAWVGVTCTADSDIVEALDFSGWGVNPNMTSLDVLSALKGLRRLDLSSNKLPFLQWLNLITPSDDLQFLLPRFNIPDSIGNLTTLTYLDLSGNGYEGEIPGNISACQNLRYLSVADNQLGGGISAVANITSLETLYFANNLLNGTFPDLGEMPRLLSLDLSNNRFTGPVPDLSNLPQLRQLKLDNNFFTELPGDKFFTSTLIEEFSLSGNQLRSRIPPSIANIANIKVLNLSNNQLFGPIPSALAGNNLKDSFSLDLSQNKLTGSIPANLVGPPVFDQYLIYVSINISRNLLTGNISSVLEELQPGQPDSYISLDLSYNQLSGAVPSLSGVYSNSIYITFLINDNQLSGDIVHLLVGIPQGLWVRDMRLQNNQFTGDMSRLVANLQLLANWTTELRVLDMSNNKLQWSTSESMQDPLSFLLGNLPPLLAEFRVGGNDFSGISLPTTYSRNQSISEISVLEVLNLSNCHLTGGISGAIFNNASPPSLQVVDLSSNEASGQIPTEINFLLNLTVFDVSNNDLSGSLYFILSSSPLYRPNFFLRNIGLCDGPLAPCNNLGYPSNFLGAVWYLLIIEGLCAISVLGTCLVAACLWRVYNRSHKQDAELIRTLMEGESPASMSLRKVKKATNNFAESEQIGEGGFGKVFRGTLSDGTIVAIKRSKREGLEKDKERFLNEVRILTQLKHRYLVELLGCCMENKIAVLVLEFVSNGTLQEHLQRKSGADHLSWKQRLNIAVQTADALNYLHSAAKVPIYHRDVKSANVLLDDGLNAKVADFGISKVAPVEVDHVSTIAIQGTMGYIDPEYYMSSKFTDRSDVYSFGVVLLELISAKPAIDFGRCGDESSLVIFAKPHVESGDLKELIDPSLLETYLDPTGHGRESILGAGRLAVRCLNMRSKARPSMQDVWKELQSLQGLVEPEDNSVHLLEAINSEDPQHNYGKFLHDPESSFDSRSPSTTENCPRSLIEMSQFSR